MSGCCFQTKSYPGTLSYHCENEEVPHLPQKPNFHLCLPEVVVVAAFLVYQGVFSLIM
jgi:hypothetical protein